MCLCWIFHHAILDGWSVASLMTEWVQVYDGLRNKESLTLNRLKSSYKDYVIEQMIAMKDSDVHAYWRRELADYKRMKLVEQNAYLDRKRELTVVNQVLTNELATSVQRLARQESVSMKVIYFAAYVYAMSMLTYEQDLTVGLIRHHRPMSVDGDAILGCFKHSTNSLSAQARMHMVGAYKRSKCKVCEYTTI